MSFPPALPTSSIVIHLRASPDSRLWRGACIPLVTGLLLKVSALLGVRRKIDYVGRKTSGNTYGISGLDVASDYRSGLLAIGGLAFGWNASSKLDATQQSVTAQLKTAQQAAQQDMSYLKDRL